MVTAADITRREAEADEEYRRLLYVAMTRAADLLFIAGYRGKTEVPACWHNIVWNALSADEKGRTHEIAVNGPNGEEWPGLVFAETTPPRSFAEADGRAHGGRAKKPLPDTLLTPYRDVERPLPPLSPSKAGVEVEDPAPMTASPLFSDAPANLALERGRLVHRLLQLLPGFEENDRADACRRYLERAAHHLPKEESGHILESVMAVLADDRLASVFSTDARAEVSVTGSVRLGESSYTVSGRLDRLSVREDTVVLVDFKTNRNPPSAHGPVPLNHAAQMAVYRAILGPLYPQKSVECLLVYTETASVRRLEADELDAALAALSTK